MECVSTEEVLEKCICKQPPTCCNVLSNIGILFYVLETVSALYLKDSSV
jgi:hypothetical protein